MRQRSYLQLAFIGLLSLLYLAPLSFINVSAEQTNYNGLWITENQLVSQSYDQQGNIRFAFNVVAKIYTNDPSASGTVQVTYYENYYPNQAITENVSYQGYYTEVVLNNYYSDLNGSLRQVGTFTVSNNNISTQIVELDDDQLQALINQFSAIQNALDNVDETIDTISWVTNGDFLGYSLERGGTYSNTSINTNQTDLYFKIHVPTYTDSRLYKIETAITTSTRLSGGTFDTSILSYEAWTVDANGYTSRSPVVYLFTNGAYLTLFTTSNIGTSTASSIDLIFHIKSSQNRLRVAASSKSSSISYINSDDIEYWQMLYYLNALNGQTVIINNQQTVINQQNQNNEYNQQEYDTDNNEDQTDDIEGFMVDYDNKLGFIGQTFDFITSLFGVITNADISSTIPFPGVTVPIGENGSNVTLIQAQNVDIVPSGLSNIFEYVRLANSLIIVSAVFNMAINKYKEWSMK